MGSYDTLYLIGQDQFDNLHQAQRKNADPALTNNIELNINPANCKDPQSPAASAPSSSASSAPTSTTASARNRRVNGGVAVVGGGGGTRKRGGGGGVGTGGAQGGRVGKRKRGGGAVEEEGRNKRERAGVGEAASLPPNASPLSAARQRADGGGGGAGGAADLIRHGSELSPAEDMEVDDDGLQGPRSVEDGSVSVPIPMDIGMLPSPTPESRRKKKRTLTAVPDAGDNLRKRTLISNAEKAAMQKLTQDRIQQLQGDRSGRRRSASPRALESTREQAILHQIRDVNDSGKKRRRGEPKEESDLGGLVRAPPTARPRQLKAKRRGFTPIQRPVAVEEIAGASPFVSQTPAGMRREIAREEKLLMEDMVRTEALQDALERDLKRKEDTMMTTTTTLRADIGRLRDVD